MESAKTLGTTIISEISTCFDKLDPLNLQNLQIMINRANNIFVLGAGRSKILLSTFCMRLNHLGYPSYVAGEVPCPPAKQGDLIIVASGSGETKSVLSVLTKAKEQGAEIALFTASPKSPIAQLSELIVDIPAPNQLQQSTSSCQLMRTLFEQVMFISCESIIAFLSQGKSVDEIVANHTNLE
ncbi:MAG: 6-phospho-3-hexuloisomerase [Sphaerochaetaceae bacterium]